MTKLSVTIFFLLTTLAVLGGCGKREEPALATSNPPATGLEEMGASTIQFRASRANE